MTSRRALVKVVAGGVGTSFLSGCISSLQGNQIQDSDGDGMVDSKDYAPNDPDVQEKSDVSGGSSGAPSSSSQSDADKSDRKEILSLYNEGVGQLNDGTKLLDSAINTFNNDRLDESISLGDNAQSKFATAESKFSRAVNTSLRIGHEQALELSQDAQKYALHMQLAAQYSSMAADSAKKGDTEQANKFIDKHREEYKQARELGVRDPPVVKDVLGL